MNGVNPQFQTASDVAYNIIAHKIISGEYPAGMKLSRRKMAEATGVSVIPVIEALKKLEENYLVESKPQWGSFVTIPTKEKIIQTYEVREALECQVAYLLAGKMTVKQQAEISELALDLDTVPYLESNKEEAWQHHWKFHTYLAAYTGNDMLQAALKRTNLFWILCNALKVVAPQKKYPRYWHRKLVDTIMEGDKLKAEQAMREHVRESLPPILAAIENKELVDNRL